MECKRNKWDYKQGGNGGCFQRNKVRAACLEDKIERERQGVNGIIVGLQMERPREGVAIMLNDVWHSAVIDFGGVSFRILLIKFKFSRVKVCMVVRYGPSEDVEERDRFWNGM